MPFALRGIAPLRKAENEVDVGSLLVVVVERHPSARVHVRAAATGDREFRVGGVRERAFDRELALWEERRPHAFPPCPLDGADAEAVVGADLLGVGGV